MSVESHPNVVFIVGDTVGWGDVGCYGGLAPTPRLDALAAEGMRFKNYNVEAQCTPTRSALLTGRLPIRTGNVSVPMPGEGDYGLAPWEYTIGELFSDAGYATAAFGNGMSVTSRVAYRPIRASTSGTESRTPPTSPCTARIRCSPNLARRCRRSGRAWPDRPSHRWTTSTW